MSGPSAAMGSGASGSALVVETVSINVDDFSESFLTCGTCLCAYDQRRRRPKLLACSHTVCEICLATIANMPQAQDTGQLQCPICRVSQPVPAGGVSAVPPSFLVNRLIDLMHTQRRSIVPQCALHVGRELLFCETCDRVFCAACHELAAGNCTSAPSVSGGQRQCSTPSGDAPPLPSASSAAPVSACHNHTIVPFSLAIKRMSEIMLYKANQCVRHLQRAADNVQAEMDRLDANVDTVLDDVNDSFQRLSSLLEERKRELIALVRRTRDAKRRVLQEQLAIVSAERAGVEQQCAGAAARLHYQVDVRTMTQRIADLNVKVDEALTLLEPRENAFLRLEPSADTVLLGVQAALDRFGQLYASRTFPPLCTVSCAAVDQGDSGHQRQQYAATGSALPLECASHVRRPLLVATVDYNGARRTGGGDPLRAALVRNCCDRRQRPSPQSQAAKRGAAGDTAAEQQQQCSACKAAARTAPPPVNVEDRDDGTYLLTFRPTLAGDYRLHIEIFDRAIKGSPLHVAVTDQHRPVNVITSLGGDYGCLRQPVKVASCPASGHLYVLDAAGRRVLRVAADSGQCLGQVPLGDNADDEAAPSCAVGLAFMPAASGAVGASLFTLDWRTRLVSQWAADDGHFVRSFTFSQFVEPIDMAMDACGRLLVLDSGAGKVFALEHTGRPLFSFAIVPPPLPPVCRSPAKIESLPAVSSSPVRRSRRQAQQRRGSNCASATAPTATCLGVGIDDDIVLGTADGRLLVYDARGAHVRTAQPLPPAAAGLLSAVCVDRPHRLVLAAVCHPRANYLAVLSYKGALLFTMRSDDHRLRRPVGLCIGADRRHVFVADLAAGAVKQYAYK